MPLKEEKVLRIIDANFNRAKEGLRVVEDILRFLLQEDTLRRRVRTLRHSLDSLAKNKLFKEAIKHRNSQKDPGKDFDRLEAKRKNYKEILYINLNQ